MNAPRPWYSFADSWAEGMDAGGGAGPAGQFAPKRGFGKVWREQPDVQKRLGYALSEELTAVKKRMAKHGKPPRPVVLHKGDGNETSGYIVEIGPDGTRRISADGAEDHALALEAWRAAGNRGKPPPPLIQLEELPECYRTDEPFANTNDLDEIEGRGARKRTVVNYNDGLDDDQWAMASPRL